MSRKRLTQEEFIQRCKDIHGDIFDYSKVLYKNFNTKVMLKCKGCDLEWLARPSNVIHSKSKCPKCQNHQKNTKTIIDEIIRAHGNEFILDRLVYVNCNTKVTIGCRSHGYFDKWPNDIKNGSGCPRCSGTKVMHDEFISEMSLKHTDFDFSKFVYVSAKTPGIVICKRHGEITLTPNRLKTAPPNRGCPGCGTMRQIETAIAKGRIRHPKDIPEYELYRKAVWKISNQQFIEHYYKINPENIRRGPKYHLDHKYSIQQGWLNKIPPEIIGGWKNLQILPAKSNQTKSSKCSVTLESIL